MNTYLLRLLPFFLLLVLLSRAGFGQREAAVYQRSVAALQERIRTTDDTTAAFAACDELLRLATRRQDTATMATTWDLRARLHLRSGAFDRAELPLEQALRLFRATGDTLNVAKSTNNLGILREYAGDFLTALSYHQESLGLRRALGDTVGMATSLNNTGTVLGRLGRNRDAIKVIREAAQLDSLMGSPNFAQDISNLANLYTRTEDFETAILYSIRALELGEKYNKVGVQYSASLSLADLYQRIFSLDRAEHYGQQALNLAIASGDRYNITGAYAGLADLRTTERRWTQSRELFRKALETSFADDTGVLHYGLGVAYREEGLPDSARAAFHRGLEVGHRLADSLLLVRNYSGLLEMCLRENDLAAARPLVDSIRAIDVRQGEEDVRYVIFSQLGRYYQQSEQFREAARQLDSANVLLSTVNDQAEQGRNDLALFDFYRKENELLEQQLQLSDAVTARRRYFLLFLLAGAVLLGTVIALVLLARNRRQSLSFQNALREKNEELTESNHLLTLAKEDIHHRVQNDFHAISSLLSFQASEASPEDADLLDGVGNRIVAMGRIHSLLYQRQDRTATDLNEYLAELVETTVELREGAYEKGAVRIQRELSPAVRHTLTFTQSTQLGMIVNEVITNALKYGLRRGRVSTILVRTFLSQNGQPVVEVTDEGGGGGPTEDTPTGGFGLTMVRELSEQMGWRFHRQQTTAGTQCQLIL